MSKRDPEPGAQSPEQQRLLAASALQDRPDPQALQGRFTGILLFSVCAAACGSSFIFGYNIGVVNAPKSMITAFIKENHEELFGNSTVLTDDEVDNIFSWVVSVFPLGGVVGGLLCGVTADKFGRKGAMLLNNVLALIATALLASAKVARLYPLLFVGRIVIGLNCGLNSGLAPMYLTEIAPVNLRGMLGSVNQLMVTVSILISCILGLPSILGTRDLWPLLFAFIAVPAVWQLISLPFCPESPKYLMIIKNQREEAEKALKRLRQKVDVSAEMKMIQDEADKLRAAPTVRFGDMFSNPVLRWALIIAVMMMLAQQLSGINAAMYFSSDIFIKNAKMTPENANYATIGMTGINVLMTVISTVIVDKLGRRILMLAGMGGMWVFSILIVITLYLLSVGIGQAVATYCAIFFVYAFVISFATGPGSIPWFYVSELFDQGARGNANSVAVMTNWLSNFVVGVIFLPLQAAIKGFSFLVFTACLTFFWIFTFFFVPETKNRSLDDIVDELKRKAPCSGGN